MLLTVRDPDPVSSTVRAQTVTSTKKKTRGVFIFHLRLRGGKNSSPIGGTAQTRVWTNGVKLQKTAFPFKKKKEGWSAVSLRSVTAPHLQERQLYCAHLSSSPALLRGDISKGSPWKRNNIPGPPLNRAGYVIPPAAEALLLLLLLLLLLRLPVPRSALLPGCSRRAVERICFPN